MFYLSLSQPVGQTDTGYTVTKKRLLSFLHSLQLQANKICETKEYFIRPLDITAAADVKKCVVMPE